MANIIFDKNKKKMVKQEKDIFSENHAECYMQCHRLSSMADKHHDDGGSNRVYHPNSSNMFPGNFSEGLRVLVFDKDQDYLLQLEKYLKHFHYEVTCCNDEERAMYLVSNHRDRFDIALIEVQKTDGDKLRLLSEIRSEMDLPIIIMSEDDSPASVINWMSHGARDYLIKPLRLQDLRLLFKYVAKKILGYWSVVAREIEEKAGGDRSPSADSTIKNPNKIKRRIFPDEKVNEEDQDDHDLERDQASTTKKRRLVWDDELHKKFIHAVELIGLHKAVPKKILEIMNVENISRENVASHLQKFRMRLRDQKKKEEMYESLLTPQEGRMYVREEIQNFYEGRNVQFPTHHRINNIPHHSVQQHSMNPNNPMMHLMTPVIGHHHDGVSIAVSGRNLVMTHHHHLHHQVEFNDEESLGYTNLNEDGPTNLPNMYSQNSEEVSLFHFQNREMAPMMVNNNHHLSTTALEVMNIHQTTPSSILHLNSFPSTSDAHTSFLNQRQENGGFNFNGGYLVNNKRHEGER